MTEPEKREPLKLDFEAKDPIPYSEDDDPPEAWEDPVDWKRSNYLPLSRNHDA